MTGSLLRLRAYEVWSALEVIDPVAVLAEDLIGRTVSRSGHVHRKSGHLAPWSGSERNGNELVVLEHPATTTACVVPAQCLRDSLAAALAAVAARELLVGGAVTVGMLGSAQTVQTQLAVIARHVPDISHVALCLADGQETVEPKLADQLELTGIGLSVVPTLAEAVFGANLVVATNHSAARQDLTELRLGQLAKGAVVVNATGKDLPADLVDQVDQVYVDDFDLLSEHPERRVVATHHAEWTTELTNLHGGAGPRISADLAQLLTGRHSGRRRGDDIVLVELLGAQELNAELAYRICEGAARTGLGVRVTD
jgi:ornithine cyclodeaminase/alanine dehydrogenase-like protein (mu-crystallin family)